MSRDLDRQVLSRRGGTGPPVVLLVSGPGGARRCVFAAHDIMAARKAAQGYSNDAPRIYVRATGKKEWREAR